MRGNHRAVLPAGLGWTPLEGCGGPFAEEIGGACLWQVRKCPGGRRSQRASIGPSGRPAKRCTCKCGTSWPACSPILASRR